MTSLFPNIHLVENVPHVWHRPKVSDGVNPALRWKSSAVANSFFELTIGLPEAFNPLFSSSSIDFRSIRFIVNQFPI